MTGAGLPVHAQQALIGTGNMEDENQTKVTLVRVVLNYIFFKGEVYIGP
jgi:fructose-1,6-bisphosphatase/sedoheptulose 1,7-bisphosphatase-like protein